MVKSNQRPNRILISVDIELADFLKKHSQPFESRNTVLRRLLGLPPAVDGRKQPEPNARKSSRSKKL